MSRTMSTCQVGLWILLAAVSATWAMPDFAGHTIDQVGNRMGQTSLADLDRDGDLDWVAGAREGDVWWFEFRGPRDWVRHTIGGKSATDVGGTMFDVDGDGDLDQASGGVWYRNEGDPKKPWTRFENGGIFCHDDVAADIDGDGRLDMAAMRDRDGVFWYTIPDDPTQKWISHKVGPGVHGGIGPRGIADLDGDGDNDIVRSNAWFENVDGKGLEWRMHETIDFGQADAPYPFMTKAWTLDLDGDGDIDIVEAEGDCVSGRVAWFENVDRARQWKRHMIAGPTGQDLHSLAVADFDDDGDMDVFSGGGPLTKGTHKWFIWENVDGQGGDWKEHLIFEGKRCHETVAGDVDGDGDIDLCSKPWNGNEHVFLENQLYSAERTFGVGKQAPVQQWTRTDNLGQTPERTTDALPLSDQQNEGGWQLYEPMTDEFEGDRLDEEKWWPRNPTWLGRQPALFDPENVEVRDGKLHLWMRKKDPGANWRERGYHTWTSAAVQSKGTTRYGYFEVKAKPMDSAGSSSFWFYHSTPKIWTEIDVFEIGGGSPGFERKVNMNVHVFHTPAEKNHWSTGGVWSSSEDLADGWHVYGLEWGPERVRYYFDGVLIRWVENTHWRQPLTLNFDSETMPDWFGLPKDEDLPSVYSVEYVRVWKKTQ